MSSTDDNSVHLAVMRHSMPELLQSIVRGGNVDAPDREGRTPLFYAAKDGDITIAEELLRHGANANVQDKGQKTPLHFAAIGCQAEAVELLLKNGAKVDAQDHDGNTPLSDAVFYSKGRGEVIKILLSWGANESLKNKHGVSPKELANSIGNYDVASHFHK